MARRVASLPAQPRRARGRHCGARNCGGLTDRTLACLSLQWLRVRYPRPGQSPGEPLCQAFVRNRYAGPRSARARALRQPYQFDGGPGVDSDIFGDRHHVCAVAGYFGGRIDEVLMRAVDVLYSLPDILLIVILMALFERSLLLLFVALGATSWLTMARIVRGQVLSLKQEQFVEAARCIGVSNFGIVVRHILPNTLGPIIVYATLTIPSVILSEAFLSFLGLGVPPPAS